MATIREKAAADARRVLGDYWVAGKFPVDPAIIAIKMGIEVYRARLDSGTSGMIIKQELEKPARIYLHDDEPPARQAFTCAHELGHYVERMEAQDGRYSFIDLRKSGAEADAHEWYANHFAANLLMPQRYFLELADEGWSRADIAKYFAVSQPAVRARADVLGIVRLQ